ncbi:MAG: hypothetical protein E6271_05830 [Negativicoccus succinicivorans]|nr:hypothetical protein [Negativicoccus succinicivorans]
MDTIAKNKLTQGKYGRLKKKLTQLQNKKEWLIDQQKNTADISAEIDKTKKQFDEMNQIIAQQRDPYQKIIQELTGQNEEIKKQIWKNNAIIGRLKKELHQTKDNHKEIYNLKNNELVRAAGGKKVGGGGQTHNKKTEDIIDKILNSDQDLQQLHISTRDEERNKEAEIGI